jgi:hypothetical protein
MRFVRVYTRTDTGEIILVAEQELPFAKGAGLQVRHEADPPLYEIEMHELGLADHFTPTTLEGAPCNPAHHLRLRIERVPDTADHAAEDLTHVPMTRFRAIAGHEDAVPEFMDVPTTLEGCKAKLRARGGAGCLHPKARAWLALMLPPHEVEALGVHRTPLTALKALDDMRFRRDPSVGSRRGYYERLIRERDAARARTSQRKAAESEARAKAIAFERVRLEVDRVAELAGMHDTEGNVIDG